MFSSWQTTLPMAYVLKAIQLVFNYLPRAVKYGAQDLEAREKCTMLRPSRYGIC